MTKKGDKANEFMRKKLGAGTVDEAAAAGGLRVLDGDGGGEDEKEDGVPWIELPGVGRQLSMFAKEVGSAMCGQAVFRRDEVAVTVDEESGMMKPITAQRMRSFAEKFCVTYKLRPIGRGDYENEPTTMPKECAGGLIDADDFYLQLRRIERVNACPMPFFSDAGKLSLLNEGYDARTRTYTMKSGIKIDEAMTAAEGKAMVEDYISEFCFNDARSRSVCVAAMFSVFCFYLQEPTAARMSFVYRSNVPGAGKSLAAQFAIIPFYGLSKVAPLSDEEELRKLLDTTAMAGLPYIFLDNLTGNVKSKLLDAYLTSPMWSGRVLGTNKYFDAPANAMLFITGNGITLSDDIARRSLVCNLNIEDADLRERKIKRVIDPNFLARPEVRGDLISALWAMLKHWEQGVGGKRMVGQRVPTFEGWSELIGGIVAANGFGDCLERPADEESANPKDVHKRHLLERLVTLIAPGKTLSEFKFEEIIDECRELALFDWMIDGRMVKKREKLDNGDYDDWEEFECNRESRGKMSDMLNREMAGQKFRLKDGRKVQFGKRGQARHRKYLVTYVGLPEAVDAPGVGGAPAAAVDDVGGAGNTPSPDPRVDE